MLNRPSVTKRLFNRLNRLNGCLFKDFYLLQTSLRHIRNRRRACCSASTLAFSSAGFGPVGAFGTLGSSGSDSDPSVLPFKPEMTERAASIKRSKNIDLSSLDGLSTV